MFLVLLSLLFGVGFLFWMFWRSGTVQENSSYVEMKTNTTLLWVRESIEDICNHCGVELEYEILASDLVTYTDFSLDKPTINLVVWDKKMGRPCAHNAIIYNALCELSLILGKSVKNARFVLFETASSLGYYDETFPTKIVFKD